MLENAIPTNRSVDHAEVRALLGREHRHLRRAYMIMVHRLRVLARFHHRPDMVMAAMHNPVAVFAVQPRGSFARAYRAEFARLSSKLQKAAPRRLIKQPPRLPYIGDEEASDLMQDNELEFIKDFTDDQRDLVRNVLADAIDRGYNPTRAARSFRDAIGLTDSQAAAVRNYRNLLESGSSDALNRELRDGRFDRTVTGAINRGDVLTGDQVDRMVNAYSDNFVAHRADTIALTESHRALSLGRYAALQAYADEYDIGDARIKRTWNTTLDGRERETHGDMDGQEVSGFEPYLSPSGARLMYPGDPAAPAEEVIRCRCIETYDIDTGDDDEGA